MALAKRTARQHNRLRFPPYGKELFARRMAEEPIGLCVIAAGSFNEGMHYAGNPRVHRLVAPLDLDLGCIDWRILMDLDVLVCPADNAPDSWLNLLMQGIFAAGPRLVFCEISTEDADGETHTGIFRVRAFGRSWGPGSVEPCLTPAELPLYIARQSQGERLARRIYDNNFPGETPDMEWYWR